MRHQHVIEPHKVAIYVRWSTEDQGSGTTLEVQREGCSHYLLSQGWQVRDELIFIDDGYTGGNLIRPGMTRLRDMIQNDLIDCVVVYKLDRLSRSVLDTVTLVLEEWEGKTYVKSAREALDTTNPMGKQWFYMLINFAEFERSSIRERTYSGKLATARKGRNAGQPPAYGYRRGSVKGTMEVIDEQVNVVRRIYHLYSSGLSVRSIAHLLNGEGIKSQKGGAWTPTNINNVLKNEIYIGRMVYGRTTKTKDRSGKWVYGKNEVPLVSVDTDSVPHIIDKDLFASIQKLRESRNVKKSGISGRALGSDTLLSGMTKCGFCGKTMQLHKNRDKLYFRCWSAEDMGKSECASGHALVSVVTDVMMERVKDLFISKHDEGSVVDLMVKAKKSDRLKIEEAIVITERSIISLTDKAKRLTKDYLDGELPGARYDKLSVVVETELEILKKQLENLKNRLNQEKDDEINIENIAEMTANLGEWDSLSMVQQKTLLRTWVKCVRLSKASHSKEYHIEVQYKWND